MKQWEKMYFYPVVLEKPWVGHEHYGESCTLIKKDKYYPLWKISFANGDIWYANERELRGSENDKGADRPN